jgi:hypothetical protein
LKTLFLILWCGTADAFAVLLLSGKVDSHGAVTAVALSSDHTPMDAKEAERIIATGVSMPA